MVLCRSWPPLQREARADGFIDRQRAQRHMIADPADHRHWSILRALRRSSGAMAPVDAILPTPFEHRVLGYDDAAVDDADEVRQLLDLDDPSRRVGHAVIVAVDRHEPVMADPPLELQDGVEAV